MQLRLTPLVELVSDLLNTDKLRELRDIQRRKKHNNQPGPFQVNPDDYDFSQPTHNIYAPPNTLSQDNNYDSLKLSLENIDSNIFRMYEKATLNEIS